jgi:hypothetical protein
MQTNFLLGSLQITEEARVELKRVPYDLVARHAINEHGLITKSERKQNELSMRTIGPVRSRYMVDPTNPKTKFVRVETSAKWAETTISIED